MEVTVSDAARSFIEGCGGRLYVRFAPVGPHRVLGSAGVVQDP
jgi:hypothetical protein